MLTARIWINKPWFHFLQHIFFWILSYAAFLYLFKTGSNPGKIDYVYTALFHVFIIPLVYMNLYFLLPRLRKTNSWILYSFLILTLITAVSLTNYTFFSKWSNFLLPDYFFISYFSFIQVLLIFLIYTIITSLLKLSKSWFAVIELQGELLAAEKQKTAHEKELIELEAKALRAQMNPHFIYNCLNSIKSLIQTEEKQNATDYLTTFSKLIRTLFQNSDKRQISLYDEIETCKLYTQLESMRFGNKLNIYFQIDPDLDLKSVLVPALIIQPFIENAIWHGIVPKEKGGAISVNVTHSADQIICVIDDDGIGRKLSAQNKPADAVTHESKGVHLSQARLNLEKSLNDTNASIEIIDKYENNFATGTKVILTFNRT